MSRAALCGVAVAAFLLGCSAEVLHDLDETQANEVLAALQSHNIPATKRRVSGGNEATYTVEVPRADAPGAWRVLQQQYLPRVPHPELHDLLGNIGLVPTAAQERALIWYATASELARTLEVVDRVQRARVHLVIPAPNPMGGMDEQPSPPRASVLLKVSGEPPLSTTDVQRLVSGSIENLSPADVSVVLAQSPHNPAPRRTAKKWRQVGPFRVAPESWHPLRWTLVSAIVLLSCAVLFLLYALRTVRRLRRHGAGPEGGASGPSEEDLESSLRLVSQASGRTRR